MKRFLVLLAMVVGVLAACVLHSYAAGDGGLTNIGGNVIKAPGAKVERSHAIKMKQYGNRPYYQPYRNFIAGIFNLIITLILGLIVAAVLPAQTKILADTFESKPLPSLGVGLLGTILLPGIFLVLVLIIIVGWLLIPFVALAIAFLYLFGYVGIAEWLGGKIIEAAKLGKEKDTPIIRAFIGILALGIAGLVPIVGGLVVLAAVLAGFGAVILSRFGTGKPWTKGHPAENEPVSPSANGTSQGAA